jgi:hypothetical protein
MIDYENIAASVPGPEPAGPPPPSQPQFNTETVFESDATPEAIAAAQARLNRPTLPVTHERYQGLAAAKGYKQEDFSGNRLQKVRYTHEAMIDVLIAEPTITQNDLAKRFEMSVSWVSIVLGSDSFQAALTKRREELTDPFLIATIEERFRGLAQQSLEVIADNLEKTRNTDLALKALDMSAKALGFGARVAGPAGTVQNNFVVQLPPKMADSNEWAQAHGKIIEQP